MDFEKMYEIMGGGVEVKQKGKFILKREALEEGIFFAKEKMSGYISRFGNEDGRFDEDYLFQLIIEELQKMELQRELLELSGKNPVKEVYYA